MTTPDASVTIAIPTYRREKVLIDTIAALLALDVSACEILILDQTEHHEQATTGALAAWNAQGFIRWVRLSEPSIPKAMNEGLRLATAPWVLFLDDDIRPGRQLISAHMAAHATHPQALIAGRVLQPWDEGRDYSVDRHFHFAAEQAHWIDEFMGGNFSVHRETALSLGGFDENFVRVAYRFEAEFAHRFLRSGRRIYYEPAACLHHLKAGSGGTRTFGEHLVTWRPDHAVGAYYYALRTGNLRTLVLRPIRSLATRYHLRHPWRIPATLVAELGGIIWAVMLHVRGPRYATRGRTH